MPELARLQPDWTIHRADLDTSLQTLDGLQLIIIRNNEFE